MNRRSWASTDGRTNDAALCHLFSLSKVHTVHTVHCVGEDRKPHLHRGIHEAQVAGVDQTTWLHAPPCWRHALVVAGQTLDRPAHTVRRWSDAGPRCTHSHSPPCQISCCVDRTRISEVISHRRGPTTFGDSLYSSGGNPKAKLPQHLVGARPR